MKRIQIKYIILYILIFIIAEASAYYLLKSNYDSKNNLLHNKNYVEYIVSHNINNIMSENHKVFIINFTLISIIILALLSFIAYIRHSISSLKENMDFLKSITDNMTDGLLVLDKKLNVLSANPAAEKLFDIYLHEICHRNISSIMKYKDERNNIVDTQEWPLFDYLNYGLIYKAEKGYYITQNLKELPVEISASPRYQNADLVGFLIVLKV